jgi:hypothetical protein
MYGFETLHTTETLQLEHDKNILEFFFAVWNFLFLKIQKNFLKYVYI